jgi:guanylate kinase
MLKEDKFVEFTEFAKNFYGTSKAAIEAIQSHGKRCILDIDLQGVKSVRNLGLFAQIIFINPPSIEALRTRLLDRGTESKETLDERLRAAEKDMQDQANNPGLCDRVIINDVLERAFKEVEEFIFSN